MKRKIKLRDLTKEQWDNYINNICRKVLLYCKDCPFYGANCGFSEDDESWINHKDLYSDKFLNQEVEIEVFEGILTKEEKEYLSKKIKPFRHRVISIAKIGYNDRYFIAIRIQSKFTLSKMEHTDMPIFNTDMYEGMESNKDYTFKELGL